MAKLYSFCVYPARSSEKADDLCQDTFLIAMEKGSIYEDQNPKAYLITIAANLCKNQKNKYAVRKQKANIIYFHDENLEQLDDSVSMGNPDYMVPEDYAHIVPIPNRENIREYVNKAGAGFTLVDSHKTMNDGEEMIYTVVVIRYGMYLG